MKHETMQEGVVKTGKEQRRLCAAHTSFILHPSTFSLLAEAPGGVPKLRELILQLAVRGELVPWEKKIRPWNGTRAVSGPSTLLPKVNLQTV